MSRLQASIGRLRQGARDTVVATLSRVTSEEFVKQVKWEILLIARRALSEVDPRHRRKLADVRRHGRQLRINFGSGPWPTRGWLNVDVAFGPDLVEHLGHRMRLPSECAALVFAEHVFEHLTYPQQTGTFLSEVFRILEAGGRARLIVPDGEKVIRAYAADDQALLRQLAPGGETGIAAVNRTFREGGTHKYAWDFSSLRTALEEVGFRGVRRAAFRDSPVAELNIDLDESPRRLQSLYVEAHKPG